METQRFKIIIEKLRNGEISPDEAKLLLSALKTQKDSLSPSLSQQDSIETTETTTIHSKSAIAVIGMSGQFPDAPDTDTFWQNLMQGHDAIRELPAGYLNLGQNRRDTQKIYQWGGVLTERDCFDPLFFNISPREAESMNPHQRLVLQEGWKALEDGGYNPKKFAGSQVGIFIGAEPTGYFYESFTGASDAIIASRLSYFLDLKGAAIVVNTGCSSSGTAIHLACESLRNGESMVAIAGGVYANLSQHSLIPLADIGMLSPTGSCCTFDETANGTVLSEGIGIVVLKRLEDAISDGDHIYGVIRGTGTNQDGASNGITAPNGIAQEQLITSVYKQFGINPEEITYFEAHGTGTKLGDPVELNALGRAYKQFTNREHYCIIGSAKPHIGHTAAASGVTGLIKVLLSMQNHQIPGLIHFKKLNPLIELEGSAFYVNSSPVEWRSKNGKPLMAALNSFGHSGTNVHLVIQEYISPNETFSNQVRPDESPALIPISAKNKERLKEYVNNLLKYLKNSNVNLTALAYTLQIGREAMEERIIFLIHDVSELRSKLDAFLADTAEIANCWRGQVKQGKNPVRLFATDEDMQEAVEKWFTKGKLGKIAELWTQGLELDWHKLYGEIKPRRISLPTYPFAKESYWIPEHYRVPEMETKLNGTNSIITTVLHSLLQQNTSDLSEQRYSSTFTGREFFLKDHVVMGQRILPGVAYLEMARAAVAEATGIIEESKAMIRIKNIIWARPMVVGERPVQIHIGLYPESNGEIAYEIYSLADTDEIEPLCVYTHTVYSQGRAALAWNPEIPVLDIQAIRAKCNRRNFSAVEVYDFYQTIGVEYGPGHRGVEQVYTGEGRVIAKLSLPDSLRTGARVAETEEQYVLHPSIMDGALQSTFGMEAGDGNTFSTKPSLPFALEELEVYNRCNSNMWAVIEYSKGNTASDKVRKLDIDLCDEQGQVCVRMKGFSSRTLENEITAAGVAWAHERRVIKQIMLEPVWLEQAVLSPEVHNQTSEYTQHLVILCEPGGITPESIENELNGVRVLSLQSKQKSINKRFEIYAVRIFEEIQKIIEAKTTGKALVQVVVSRKEEQQLFAGFSGILKTAGLENPKVIGQLIELEAMEDVGGLIAKLNENAPTGAGYRPMDNLVRYQEGKRLAPGWNEVTIVPETTAMPWKDGGVYLITGGAGGLGRIFAKEIAARVNDVTLALTGRSALDENKQASFKELELNGAKVIYRSVDITDPKAVNELIASIGEEFGRLDGIIHCAGIIRDNYILKKSKEEFMEVLAPKVAGLVNLDAASKDLNLDLMVLFSSIAGSLGNPGQVDYAAANAFMDAYAGYRNALVTSGRRHGRTLSINWPLWQEGGMRVDETVANMMSQNIGMVAMRTSSGIQALYAAIASGRNQVMVLEGDIRRIQTFFSRQAVVSESEATNSSRTMCASTGAQEQVTVANPEQLREKAGNYLKKLLAPVIKLPAERIEADIPLEKYGIDSIMVMQLTNQLEKTFGSLSKTLFFEYQTIRELTGYFLETYRGQLIMNLGIEEGASANQESPRYPVTGPSLMEPVIRSRHGSRFVFSGNLSPEGKSKQTMDIAIIGVSGRYPQARNLDEFWRNLREGRDCITEIPKDRWDHSLYYDEDKNKPGKTYSKWGGFLEGAAEFDPFFFNISPREAEIMDPQERLFLECVYETLEDAGYTRETFSKYQGSGLEGNVGVYVGVMYEEYQLYGAQAQAQGFPVALSGNPSSIANRVSYFCNFHGPSMAVDTMCSSSLTAIHLACQSLQHSGCKLAVAGGVNVSIHPNKYLILAQGKFASSKGRCESFGQGGEGYVPGEGVGAVLLKPLTKAIADDDHIYGVIKGTTINHGGKTNGYTVPNPNAQAELIGQALQEAGIDPRTISYIEAHGTGTSLGDPIEITGLAKAFQKYTKDKQFCAIGSAKSNIGHCESAAGIAGVTKVLLQLKNRQIAPSLHSEVLNPNIDFINTPFVVQQELTEWKRPVVTIEGVTKEYPRVAGISSFGAGGANAHVVIEEYIETQKWAPEMKVTPRNPAGSPLAASGHAGPWPAVIVLSAKDEAQLKGRARQLLTAIAEQQITDNCLIDIAYTLQVGREAMEERLAFTADSIKDLIKKLQGFLEDRDNHLDLHHGQVSRNLEELNIFTTDEDLQNAVESWLHKGKYGKLLGLWVKGLVFDWNRLYGETKPRRISLPTYPFAKERYWFQESYWSPERCWIPGIAAKERTAPSTGITAFIHPLLQQNTSNLSQQRYSSTFTGREFFLADHIVKGQKILPGVAYLEMARVAVEQAVVQTDWTGIRLKDVVWIRPMVVGEEPMQVNIGLYPEDVDFKEAVSSKEAGAFPENDCAFPEGDAAINFEIYEATGTEDGMPIIFSQGRAFLTAEPELPVLDLKAVQAECSKRILQDAEVYETYRAMGIEYGPSHRGVEQIYVGNGQILAKLSLPAAITETQQQFVLHPSIMDAALQASIGLETSFEVASKAVKPMLPFALEELEVIGRCTSNMWALIRNSDPHALSGNSAPGDKVRKLDIDLCDEQGHICARLKGFSSRVWEGEIPAAIRTQPVWVENTSEFQVGTLMLTPTWAPVSIKRVELFPTASDQVVMVGGTKEQKSNLQKQYPNIAVLEIQPGDSVAEITRKLTEYGLIDHLLWIAPYHQLKSLADENLIKEQNQGVLQVFKIIKALLKLGYGIRELGFSLITNRTQAVHKNDKVNPTHAGLYGLVGSMAKEYPHWKIRLIDLESNKNWLVSDIFTIAPDPEGNVCAYRGGEWYRQQLIPVRSIPTKQTLYKTGGVYVVIGGAGGIGEAWSEYVIRTYQAQVIWIGRRAKDETIQAKIDRLATLGLKPQYIAADATKREALEAAYQEIKQCYSQVNGIIHAAIVLLDKGLANMTEEQFQAGLSAKVDVSVRMAQVFKEEPLDFVLFFSSMQSYSKAAGQSNYAAGCTFKDAFAGQLNWKWPCLVKVINWGYWGNVGIVASEVYRERMAQAGIGSIEPPEAMEALEKLLAGPIDQIALMKTIKPLTMEGTNPEKQITIYPENRPSVIGNINNHPIISVLNP